MSNAPNYLAIVTYRLDIPGPRAEQIVGRPDDESPEWGQALERALAEDPTYLAEFVSQDPDVDIT